MADIYVNDIILEGAMGAIIHPTQVSYLHQQQQGIIQY
jgi:hypothetical protein